MLDDVLEKYPETSAQSDAAAVATSNSERVDLHFGHAEAFTVFDVDANGAHHVQTRVVAEHALDEEEDPRATIYRMIADCKALLVAKVGAAPQEALAALGIEATNMHAGKNIAAALRESFDAKKAATEGAALDASDFSMMHAMLRVADLDRSIALSGRHRPFFGPRLFQEPNV